MKIEISICTGLMLNDHSNPYIESTTVLSDIYIRVVRRALNLLRASFSPIFQYFSAVNVTRVSFSPLFQYFLTCMPCMHGAMRHGFVSHGRCRPLSS